MTQECSTSHRWLIDNIFIIVTRPTTIYGQNPKYPHPPFLMPFIYAKDKGHKYISSITLCRGEYFTRQRGLDHLVKLFWIFWNPQVNKGDHITSQFCDIDN